MLMRFNDWLRLTRMLLVTGLTSCVLLTPVYADIFTIDNIHVDVTAQNSVQAQSDAFEDARLTGAKRLLNRLTLPEDREAIGGVWIDDQIAAQLAAAVDVQQEKRSGTRYFGILSVKFDARKIAALFNELGLPFVRSPAARALIVPIAVGKDLDTQSWRSAWTRLQSKHLLTPIVVSPTAYRPDSQWSDIATESGDEQALRGIIAELALYNDLDYVRLTELRPSSQNAVLGIAGPFTGVDNAAKGALEYLETVWKRLTISHSNTQSEYRAAAHYTSQAGWRTIHKSLQSTASVSDIQIYSVMIDGSDLSFSYAGSSDQLAAELRARGVSLSATSAGWVLEMQSR